MERYPTTRAGLRRAQQRLAQAQAAYDAVIASNPEAADAGDNSVWHDNFAYEENQRQMHQLGRRVRDLRELLGCLEVVEPGHATEQATVGCVVEIEDTRTGKTERYVLAGYGDGDISAGRVSYESPLGRALLGAAVGDCRTILVAGREREVEVLSIARAEEELR